MIDANQLSPHLSEKLGRIMENVNQLHPLPSNAARILRALERPETSAEELAEIILRDQVLTTRAIFAANTASMGFNKPSSSIVEAVVRLGFKKIRTVVLSGVLIGPMSRYLYGYKFKAGALWDHALTTASLAKLIARHVRYADLEEVYVAGLLHDIGKLILDQFVLEDYHRILAIMQKRKLSAWQVEEELFGIDHAGVGGLMASRWRFPKSLVQAIHYHHLPSLAWSDQKVAAIVNIANAFSPHEATNLSKLVRRTVNPVSLEILCIDEPALERMWQKVAHHMASNGSPIDFPGSQDEYIRR